jgi:hypothetical protein
MVVKVRTAAAATDVKVFDGTLVAVTASGFDGTLIAVIGIGPAVVSAGYLERTTGVDMAYCSWKSMLHTMVPPKQ